MKPDRHPASAASPARFVRFGFACLALVLLPPFTSARAQFSAGMKINNFSVNDPFPAPNQTQMRYKLTGAEGRPQPDDKFLLTTVNVQTFRLNGDREMIVDAPECTFDKRANTVGSAGRLILQSGDGKLRVEGDGFVGQLTNRILIISNNVQAKVQHTNANAAPLIITSRWFEFDAEKRRGTFHEDVRGNDPEFTFTCGVLSVSGSTNQASFDLIEARESLVITGKEGVRRATADRGFYRRAADGVELTGNATWDVDGKSGRADRVIGLRTNGNSVQAEGHVALRLPRSQLGGASGLLSSSNNPAQGATKVDVFADRFHWRSNVVVASGAVRVVDATNRVSFSCDNLEAHQAASQADDETAIATGNVIVERDGADIRAERADYSKRFGAAVFTGNPHWQQAQIEGHAEQVTFKTEAEEVVAENKVAVKIRIPGNSGASLDFFSEGQTNKKTASGTNRVVEVVSRRLNVKSGQALFTGDVEAYQSPRTGSEARLHSDILEVRFAAKGGRIEAITATNNVTYEQGTVGVTNKDAIYRKLTCRSLNTKADAASGEPAELVASGGVHIEQPGSEARSDQAVYNRNTDVLKLIGQPVIEMPEGTYTGAHEVEWDRKKGTISGADYKITGNPEALKRLKSTNESQKLPGQ